MKFLEPYWIDILNDKTQNFDEPTKRMIALLAKGESYTYVAKSEGLQRKDVERYFNEISTKFHHKTHKFPKPIIHIYKEDDQLDWAEGMKPDGTIKSIQATNAVLAKLKSGKQEDLLSLI